jgi:hypothetical protein
VGFAQKYRAILAAALAVFAMTGPDWAPCSAIDLQIPAQPGDKALNALSEQSGVRVLYPYGQVAGLLLEAWAAYLSSNNFTGQAKFRVNWSPAASIKNSYNKIFIIGSIYRDRI